MKIEIELTEDNKWVVTNQTGQDANISFLELDDGTMQFTIPVVEKPLKFRKMKTALCVAPFLSERVNEVREDWNGESVFVFTREMLEMMLEAWEYNGIEFEPFLDNYLKEGV